MPGRATLHEAAERGDIHTVRKLLDGGADVNGEDKMYQTPLHYAALNGHADVVRLLLERGALVHAKHPSQDSPLHYAALFGHMSTVLCLMEYKADVNALNQSKFTPLHFAASGRTAVAKVLIEAGAIVDARSETLITPLHYAAVGGHIECVRLLLDHGADVNAKNADGNTPIALCTPTDQPGEWEMPDRTDIVELLKSRGGHR